MLTTWSYGHALAPLTALATLCCVLSTSVADTTPPTVSVVYVQPFIVHALITVNLNEDGTVYCGALENTGGGSYVPSGYQLRTGHDLVGHGSTSVVAYTHAQVVVGGLMPGTVYDFYCYAEDVFINGISIADVAATRQALIVTASGGDYAPPTLEYVPPTYMAEARAIKVFVKLSEDGTVWCVAIQDHGFGTTAPSAAQIRNNMVGDAWATAAIEAQNLYMSTLALMGLDQDTAYDIYCFGVDMSGNGIDRSPAFAIDATAIPNTKLAGVRTSAAALSPTSFAVTASGVATYYEAQPATWNVKLPRRFVSGTQERYDLESWNAPLALDGAFIVDHSDVTSGGCGKLPPAPRGPPRVAMVRRGRCAFKEKASWAHHAGYQGLIVIDHQAQPHLGVLPDMTAEADDHSVAIPAWTVGKATGETLRQALADAAPGGVVLDVLDEFRKARLGDFQQDKFGMRVYASH